MQKRFWLLLLVLVACMPVPEKMIPAPKPVVEMPMQGPQPAKNPAPLYGNIAKNMMDKIPPFSLVTTGAMYDNFAIIPVERYDARYLFDNVTVVVHVFKFETREEVEVVLKSEFFDIIDRGASQHKGHNIAVYLTQDDHRVVIWSSGNALVYVETFVPDFASREIVEAYLAKYPSDLEIPVCIDSDGNDHFLKGTTTRVKIGSTLMHQWTDVCLRDFAFYRNKQYVPQKGMNEEDGLLEGQCAPDPHNPGFISEYICPRGCLDGACKVS